MDSVDDLLPLLRLNLSHGIGARTYQRLVETFGSAEEALAAPVGRLSRVQGVSEQTAEYVTGGSADDAARELERAQAAGVNVISYRQPGYPVNLKSIYNPPLVLYVRGELRPEDGFAVAIVGTRAATPYGKKQAERLAAGLAVAGCCVVSGMARGIDTAAHRGCLQANGRTIAVLGCGLARVYPEENQKLADEIAASGAVVSEFPMQAPPGKGNFPRRNRVISGLSLAVVIVEAPSGSGALITADWATQQNREVMAVPGNVESRASAGCHRLIRDGAKLVTGPEDILEEIRPGIARRGEPQPEERPILPPELPPQEKQVLDTLSDQPRHIDEIAAEAGLPVASVSAALMMLEIRKLAVQLPGKMFVKD